MRPSSRPRAAADSCRLFFNPFNPLTHTPVGRSAVAACEVFERTTRRYDKPEFGLPTTQVDGRAVRGDRGRRVADDRSAGSCISAATSSPARAAKDPAHPAGGAHVGPLRHAAARHRRDASCPITRSTSPTGRTRAMFPLSAGPLRSRRLHRLSAPTCSARFGGDVHVLRCASRPCRCSPRSR